jgi:hypothetical protein
VWEEEVGVPYAESGQKDYSDLTPPEKLYETVFRLAGNTQATNSVFRKLDLDAIIDSAHVITEGVYSPAVAAVILSPGKINIIDSFVQE